MPKKVPVSDWDRLFHPQAPRRRGPIALFISLTLMLCFATLMLVGTRFGIHTYSDAQAARALTATPLWKEYYAQQTATAQAQQAASTPTTPALQTAAVVAAGNLRSEPRIAAETVVGQVNIGDVLELREQQMIDGATWYRVLVARQGAAPAEGWVNSVLVAAPTGAN